MTDSKDASTFRVFQLHYKPTFAPYTNFVYPYTKIVYPFCSWVFANKTM
jgi:hypothetical protein